MRNAGWVLGALGAVVGWRAMAGRGSLRGKVVLVTGGSRGLGLHISRELAQRGAKLVLCARDEAELAAARDDLWSLGADVLTVVCDIGDRRAVGEMVEDATSRFGRIDVVVNNAGIMRVGPLETMTIEDFQEVMATNFWGALHVIYAVLPQMRARRSGRIVNVTSIGGRVAFPHLAPYSTAKFAMVGLSEGMRTELTAQGIRVTTVVPGFMRTGSPHHADFNGQAPLEYLWFAAGGASSLTAMNARRAARKIVRACERGAPFVTIGIQAKVLQLAHDLLPGLTAHALAVAARLLPKATGDQYNMPGLQATSRTPALIERSIERAGAESNQGGGQQPA